MDKQAKFASMVGDLLRFVDSLEDVRVRMSWAYRSPQANRICGGIPGSLHTARLAIDLVLDRRMDDGRWEWVRDSEPYAVLGEYWEGLGGAWGGRFGDGGHFSLAHGGKK